MRRALAGLLIVVLAAMSACSDDKREKPAPPPAPDLSTRPQAVAVQDGPFADTKEQLGGARTHAERSGVAHFATPDERACIER